MMRTREPISVFAFKLATSTSLAASASSNYRASFASPSVVKPGSIKIFNIHSSLLIQYEKEQEKEEEKEELFIDTQTNRQTHTQT